MNVLSAENLEISYGKFTVFRDLNVEIQITKIHYNYWSEWFWEVDIITNEVLKNVFQIDVRVMIEPYNGAPVCFGYDSVFQEENAEIYNELK